MKNDIQIDTLTSRDMESLALADKGSGDKRIAVSLYLGVKADRDFQVVANSLFSEERKKIGANEDFTTDERREIEAMFKSIKGKLRTMRLPDRARTLIVFRDDRGEQRFYKIPIYVPPKLVVERSWYVHPFVASLRKYPRYAVAFLERDRARIFDYLWGEVEDESPELKSEVPQRMNAARATNRGIEEKKIQKHIEVHIDRHLKKVAEATASFMDENDIPYLVIASRRELIARFEAFLPPETRKKVVGAYLTPSNQELEKIRTRSLEIIDDFEYAREEETVRRLIAGSSKKKKMAVLGMEPVLSELRDFKIRTLVIGKRYAPRGYLCSDDQRLYPEEEKNPACESALTAQDDLVDEIIESAIVQRVEIVHFVHEHADFDRHGVGALLR